MKIRKEKRMKKIISILLMCLIIAGVIVVATIGFNVGTKYSETTQISIKIGKEFEIKDIQKIASEVFDKQNVLVQYVELYKDMVQAQLEQQYIQQLNLTKKEVQNYKKYQKYM